MLFKPSLVVSHVTQIDLAALSAMGISGLFLDLDNTIMVSHSGKLEADVSQWLADAKSKGFQCVVVSNNKRADYCKQAESVLGFPVIYHAQKPWYHGFGKALDMTGLTPAQVAVVGDRALTDIWGGLRLGAYTVWVEPLNKHTAHPAIKFFRALECSLLRI